MEFIMTIFVIFLIGYGLYIMFVKPAAAIGKGIKDAIEQDKNVGNVDWEKAHRAETMQRFWSANNSPITLAVRAGHMTTLTYSREMSTLAVPDSAGGWDLQVTVKNKGSKTIKYITIPFTPYNTVGDRAYSSIGNTSTVNCNATGPIDPGKAQSFIFEHLWYNISLGWIETETILITFMDGTTYEWHSGLDEYFKTHKSIPSSTTTNTSVTANQWTCPKCGCKNNNTLTTCSVCKAPKPGAQVKQVEPPKKQDDEPKDVIEAMVKYKELLDKGIITQAEFDKKKKELLGL